jgi:hypothetical protein
MMIISQELLHYRARSTNILGVIIAEFVPKLDSATVVECLMRLQRDVTTVLRDGDFVYLNTALERRRI